MTETLVNFFKHASTDDLSKSLVVVALPNSNSAVHPIGSEEKHATLLYLGDDVDPTSAALVQASIEGALRDRSFGPFTERVSGVSSLGEDGARIWQIDSDNGLKVLRDRLLRAPAIRAMYDMEQQYPNYTPHVTIGYPGEGEERLSGIFETLATTVDRIPFDRIALWYGDNHDAVWRFRDDEPLMADSAEHSDLIGQVLAHGKEHGGSGPGGADAKAKEKAFDAYMLALYDHFEALKQAFVSEFGPKIMNGSPAEFIRKLPQKEQAAAQAKVQAIKVKFDALFDRNVRPLKKKFESFEHSSLTISDFLAHIGVKGMRWGVRRSDSELASAAKAGDVDNLASTQFVRANANGAHGLNDTELRELITRAQLLKQYDDVFNKPADPNSELSKNVAKLELAARAKSAEANLSSARQKKVTDFIKTASTGFDAYQKIDKATGSALSSQIRKALGLPKVPESKTSKLSREIKNMKLEKDHAKLTRDLKELAEAASSSSN